MDVVSQIKNGPMTRFQKLTIAVCMLIVIIDGYDIIVMALAAPNWPDAAGFRRYGSARRLYTFDVDDAGRGR